MLSIVLSTDSSLLSIHCGTLQVIVFSAVFVQFVISHLSQVFNVGKENRATAATNMNEHSSRSHALMCVSIVGTNKTTGAKTLGNAKDL